MVCYYCGLLTVSKDTTLQSLRAWMSVGHSLTAGDLLGCAVTSRLLRQFDTLHPVWKILLLLICIGIV